MSGIVGIYHQNHRPVSAEILQGMMHTLSHRGQDADGKWLQENVGLGHLMLWTTPESLQEQLPWYDRQQEAVITADARIDNRSELIDLLELREFPVSEVSDSFLILKAYQKWGVDCPRKLLGDFAFAIWDSKEQRMFCARDPMGIKPLYYFYSSENLVLASEIAALLEHPQVPRQLNELRIAYQLAGFLEDQEATFYQNISHLPAGHSLIVNESGRKMQRYWSFDLEHRIKLGSNQEYTEAFRGLFTEAVRCRLRSAFPVGSTLSGGLDSSSITCTARNLLASAGQKLHTFSAIFPNLSDIDLKQIDERYFMNSVKAQGQLEVHDVRADLLNPLLDWLWQGAEPVLSPNIYIHEGMYDCAQQAGVRVFLDGVDGDTTVSHGWGYLTHLAYTGNWHRLHQELGATSRNLRLSRKVIAKEYCWKPLVSEPLAKIKQKLLRRVDYGDLINPLLAQKVNLAERMEDLYSEPLVVTARQKHLSGMTTGLYPYAMEITDKATAHKSLEARYPFFDRRLMEFCLAIPLEQKFRQGYTRAILRHAMAGVLPTEVQWRVSKARLGSNFRRNLLQFQPDQITEAICHQSKIEPYVNMNNLKAKHQRYVVQKQSQPGDELDVLNAATLSLWLGNLTI